MAGLITDLDDGGALSGDEKVEVSKLSGSVEIAGMTISVDDSDSSFNDSGSGFITAGFAVGDGVFVEGFTTSTNNLFYGEIETLTAGKMTIASPDGDLLVTEAAGDSVTISKWISARIDASEFAKGGSIGDRDDVDLTGIGDGDALVWNDYLQIFEPGAAGGGGDVAVEDDGSSILSAASVLNFTGAGVSVTDAGGGQADIDIPGGGSGSGGVDIESNGSVVQLDATILNFIGATVTDQGGYQVDIDVSGGSGSGGVQANKTYLLSGTNLGAESADMTGWTSSNMSALTTKDGETPYTGSYMFGADAASLAEAYQDIDVSTYATEIDAGDAIFTLLAKMRQTFTTPEGASISIEPFDGVGGTSLGAEMRYYTSEDTEGAFWEQGAVIEVLPSGTRAVRIKMVANRLDGTNNNIAFDDFKPLITVPVSLGSSETITESGSSANLLNANRGKYQRWTATGAKTLTVQPDATEAISQDAEFYITNRAASGNLTVAEGSGVTINPPANGGLILEPGMAATLKRVTVDQFDLIGQSVA